MTVGFSSLSFEGMLNAPVESVCAVGENRTLIVQVLDADSPAPEQLFSTIAKGAESCPIWPMARAAVPTFCRMIERSEKL
jgi:hypothetical protein